MPAFNQGLLTSEDIREFHDERRRVREERERERESSQSRQRYIRIDLDHVRRSPSSMHERVLSLSLSAACRRSHRNLICSKLSPPEFIALSLGLNALFQSGLLLSNVNTLVISWFI